MSAPKGNQNAKKEDPRTERISFWLTAKESETLKKRMGGKTFSAWARTKLLAVAARGQG
jgi:hypothetical protein